MKEFVDENNIALCDIVISMTNCRYCNSNDITEKRYKKGDKVIDIGGWCECCYNDLVAPNITKS